MPRGDFEIEVFRELQQLGLDPLFFSKSSKNRRVFTLKGATEGNKSAQGLDSWNLERAADWFEAFSNDLNWYGILPLDLTDSTFEKLESIYNAYTFGLLNNQQIIKSLTHEIAFKIVDEMMSHHQQGIT